MAVSFNCKIMQFLLICFILLARLQNCTNFLPDGAIFSSLVYIKQILTLFLFSASAYYIANWINKAAIVVWVCWYGCQSVVCIRGVTIHRYDRYISIQCMTIRCIDTTRKISISVV